MIKGKLNHGLRFILKKVFSSLLFRVLGMVSALIFTWLVTTRFGSYSLGLMSINLAVLYVAATFLKLGLDTHVVSYVARLRAAGKEAEIRGYFWKTVHICLVTSLIGSVGIYLLSDWLSNLLNLGTGKNYLKITSFFLLPLVITHLCSAFLRALKKVMAYSFFLNGGISFIALLLIGPFLHRTDDLYLPLYIQLLALIILALTSTIMVFWLIRPWAPRAKTTNHVTIARESLPMMVTLAVGPMWNWGGTFIVGIFTSVDLVGVFQLLIKCSNLIGLPLRAISTIMAPILSEGQSDMDRLRSAIKKTSSLSFLLSLPVILLTVIFAKTIMSFFGPEFIPFWYLMVILCLAKFINACFGPISIILMMTGQQVLQGKLSLLELGIYLFTTTGFAWYWGLDGATAAMLLSILIRNIMVSTQVKRIFGVSPLAFNHLLSLLKRQPA